MILTVNNVYHRVGSLGKWMCFTHEDCVVPESPAADAVHEQEGNQMLLTTPWDSFEDLRSAHDELDQMSPALAHALGMHDQRESAAMGSPAWMPPLDISERKDAYLITVELPGVELDDVQVTMEANLLTIQGERIFAHDSSEQQFHRIERRYGAFRRSITLPTHVITDAVQATAGGGVLQILVPKAEEAKPKQIQVRPTDQLETATNVPAAH
jgi:HSP20 family protein